MMRNEKDYQISIDDIKLIKRQTNARDITINDNVTSNQTNPPPTKEAVGHCYHVLT